jgi:hypothetical protein
MLRQAMLVFMFATKVFPDRLDLEGTINLPLNVRPIELLGAELLFAKRVVDYGRTE